MLHDKCNDKEVSKVIWRKTASPSPSHLCRAKKIWVCFTRHVIRPPRALGCHYCVVLIAFSRKLRASRRDEFIVQGVPGPCPPQKCPFFSNIWSIGYTSFCPIWHFVAIFEQFTVCPTHRQTERSRCPHLCMACDRCDLL